MANVLTTLDKKYSFGVSGMLKVGTSSDLLVGYGMVSRVTGDKFHNVTSYSNN